MPFRLWWGQVLQHESKKTFAYEQLKQSVLETQHSRYDKISFFPGNHIFFSFLQRDSHVISNFYLDSKNEANSLDAGMYWITRLPPQSQFPSEVWPDPFPPIINKEQSEVHDDNFQSAHNSLLSEKQQKFAVAQAGQRQS